MDFFLIKEVREDDEISSKLLENVCTAVRTTMLMKNWPCMNIFKLSGIIMLK
jgi:hypothetical protein